MQQSQKPATEPEAQRLRNFRLELQRRIIQLQFFQRIAQRLEIV